MFCRHRAWIRKTTEDLDELDDVGGYDLRGHNVKVKVQRSRLQLRQGFFSQRVVCVWNSLPSSVVEASSVNIFKKKLDDWSQNVDFYSISFSSTTSTSYKYRLQVTLYRDKMGHNQNSSGQVQP